MADTIDSLQIEINAQASKANDAIDRLVGKLDRLTTSLSKINGTNLNGLANGVQRLGNAMQDMNNIKTADFTRLASNLTRLGSVNTSALNSAASSMSNLTRAFNSLGTVSANAQAVGDMAKNIAKLGNKSVQTAIANIPQLATSMNNLMTTLSRSPQVSQNVIQMTNALANLASQGSRVGTASRSLVSGLNNSSNAAVRAKKNFSGLAGAIGKFYATYFMVIRGLKGLWSSIKSTADYIEAYNYFNVSLGKIGADWSHQWEMYAKKVGVSSAEEYAESFSKRLSESLGKLSGVQISVGADGKGLLTESGMKNLGLNIQEITQYASQLASVTNSVGQTGETSLAIASSFTKLAGDISSLFNVDYSSVSRNLQSGLIGQSRALYKYGIDITNATLQTKAYELGLSKSVSEMTQAEKMQLRMLAILDQSKVSWGDLANTINSPSNMIRQFTNNLKETGMVLGQLFIPVLEKVMPVINGVTIAIKRLLVSFAQLMGVKINLDAFGQGYTDIEDGFDGISDSIDDATGSAKKFKQQLQGFDELNVLTSKQDTGTGALGGTIDLTQQIIDATAEYEKAWNDAFAKMENDAQKFADALTAIGNNEAFQYLALGLAGFLGALAVFKIGEWAQVALATIVGNLSKLSTMQSLNIAIQIAGLVVVLKFAQNVSDDIIQELQDKFNNISWNEILSSAQESELGSVLGTLWAGAVGTFSSEYGIFNNFGEWVEALKNPEVWEEISDNWQTGFELLKSDFETGWQVIVDWWNELGIVKWWEEDVAPWFTEDKWNELWINAKESFKTKWEEIKDWWNDLWFVKFFNGLKKKFSFSNMKDAFKNIKDGLEDTWDKAIESVKGLWNKFAGWLNNKLTFTIPKVDIGGYQFGGNKVQLVNIPQYATGGFPEDGWFRASKGEYFGQFDDGTSYIANNQQITDGIKQAAYEGMKAALSEYNIGNTNVNVTLEGDAKKIFKMVQKESSAYVKMNHAAPFPI